MNEMRQRGLPTRRGVNVATDRRPRFASGFLCGLVGGVAALLLARNERPDTDLRDVPAISDYPIGIGSAWGVGG